MSSPRTVVRLAESENVFVALARHSRLHQTRRSFRDDDLVVRRDVIAVRVRNKRKRLCVPRIEPQILLRQKNAALISNFDHAGFYAERTTVSKSHRVRHELTGEGRTGFIAR